MISKLTTYVSDGASWQYDQKPAYEARHSCLSFETLNIFFSKMNRCSYDTCSKLFFILLGAPQSSQGTLIPNLTNNTHHLNYFILT